MDKVLIEVVCPATSRRYEFWLARKMTVGQAALRMARDIMLYESNDGLFDEENLFLYFYENRVLLDQKHTIGQAGLRSGCRLYLV